MKRSASAMWNGDLKTGKGTLSTDSGVLSNTQYSFSTRFENAAGTNPEELIAAAHAGCFSMALSADLGRAGYTVASVETEATVHLDMVDSVPTINAIELDTRARVADIDDAEFQRIAGEAKKNCPVSRALAAVPTINLQAELVD